MDSIFDANNRQPAPPSVPPVSSYWRGSSGVHTHLHEMEYQYSVAPPTHNITSPPTTPMTPSSHLTPAGFGPPPPLHGTTGGPVYQSSAPALSHSSWPPEFRIYSLCQEIQHILTKPNVSDNNLSWEQFCVEYFHEMATMVIEVDFGNGHKRYTLQGNLILWYFKSIVQSGIASFDVKFGMKVSHSYQQQIQRIECMQARQELEYQFPHHTKVCSDGQLVLEFTMEDKPRIMTWFFHINNHVEMIPRYSVQTAEVDLSKNLTCQGLPPSTQSVLVQLGVRPHLPPKQSNIWNQSAPPTVLPQQQHHEMMTDSSILIHLPPSNNHVDIIPSLTTNPLTHHTLGLPPPSSPPPPLSLSPVMVKSNSSSYGSTCSIISNSNITTVGPSSTLMRSQSNVTSSQKMGTSPALVPKRNELVMVATEPSLFSADMVHGLDERKITRVDNHTKRVVTATPSTLSIATPSSTSSEVEVINSLTNQNSSLAWMNSSISDWNGHAPPHTDQ